MSSTVTRFMFNPISIGALEQEMFNWGVRHEDLGEVVEAIREEMKEAGLTEADVIVDRFENGELMNQTGQVVADYVHVWHHAGAIYVKTYRPDLNA